MRCDRLGQAWHSRARELGVDHLVAPPVPTGLPQDARLALRARHPLGLPVDREVGDVEPLIRLGLPARIGPTRRTPCSNCEPTSSSTSRNPASSRWSPGSRPLAANAAWIGAGWSTSCSACCPPAVNSPTVSVTIGIPSRATVIPNRASERRTCADELFLSSHSHDTRRRGRLPALRSRPVRRPAPG